MCFPTGSAVGPPVPGSPWMSWNQMYRLFFKNNSFYRGINTLFALTNNPVTPLPKMDHESTFGLKKQPPSRTGKVWCKGLLVDKDNCRLCHFRFICSQHREWHLVVGIAAKWFQNHGNSKNQNKKENLGLYVRIGSLLKLSSPSQAAAHSEDETG